MYNLGSYNRLFVGWILLCMLMLGAVPIDVHAEAGAGAGPAALLLPQEHTIIDIVKRISPTVVAVTTYGSDSQASGSASGIIISSDGQILTNNHVISGEARFTVTLADGRELDAKNLGGDPGIDLALIKINAKDLPAASLGDSDQLQVGQIAIAIGNPYGFERTVSVGVVAALQRNIPGGGMSLSHLIQTDAQIYPGNSGGPLLNSSGQVIGINTAIVGSRTGGLGFAIPINTARQIINQVRQTGHVMVPWIGVAYGEVTKEIAQVFKLPVNEGIFVAQVEKGGPAAAAGIKKGDIIVQIEGQKVNEGSDLQKVIRNMKIGDQVSVAAYREGKLRKFQVTIEEMPARLR